MSLHEYEITVIKEINPESMDTYIIVSTTPYQAFSDLIETENVLDPKFRFSISIRHTATSYITIFHITPVMNEYDAINYFEGYIIGQQK